MNDVTKAEKLHFQTELLPVFTIINMNIANIIQVTKKIFMQ